MKQNAQNTAAHLTAQRRAQRAQRIAQPSNTAAAYRAAQRRRAQRDAQRLGAMPQRTAAQRTAQRDAQYAAQRTAAHLAQRAQRAQRTAQRRRGSLAQPSRIARKSAQRVKKYAAAQRAQIDAQRDAQRWERRRAALMGDAAAQRAAAQRREADAQRREADAAQRRAAAQPSKKAERIALNNAHLDAAMRGDDECAKTCALYDAGKKIAIMSMKQARGVYRNGIAGDAADAQPSKVNLYEMVYNDLCRFSPNSPDSLGALGADAQELISIATCAIICAYSDGLGAADARAAAAKAVNAHIHGENVVAKTLQKAPSAETARGAQTIERRAEIAQKFALYRAAHFSAADARDALTLGALTAPQRAAFTACLRGESARDAAAALGISVSTYHQHLTAARGKVWAEIRPLLEKRAAAYRAAAAQREEERALYAAGHDAHRRAQRWARSLAAARAALIVRFFAAQHRAQRG